MEPEIDTKPSQPILALFMKREIKQEDDVDIDSGGQIGSWDISLQVRKKDSNPNSSEEVFLKVQTSQPHKQIINAETHFADKGIERCSRVVNLNFLSHFLPEEKINRENLTDTFCSRSVEHVRHLTDTFCSSSMEHVRQPRQEGSVLTGNITSVHFNDLKEEVDECKPHSSVSKLQNVEYVCESNMVASFVRINDEHCGVKVERSSNDQSDVCDDYKDVNGSLCDHETTSNKRNICDRKFTSENYINVHNRIHNEERLNECNVRDTQTISSMSVCKHKRKHFGENKTTRTGEKPYKCDVCGTSFAHSSTLKDHTRTHTGEKPYNCDVCKASFAQCSTLKVHLRTHSGEKPYKCDICEASFAHRSGLKAHRRSHTGEKPYKCDVCGASFAKCSTLQVHKRTHTGEKLYKCDICEASFVTRSSLKVHKRTHTGEKPYKCDVCEASFAMCSTLKIHKRIHTGEKPYKCGVCEVSFAHCCALKVHMRTHTGEKPYKCDTCNASFASLNGLNYHKRKHT